MSGAIHLELEGITSEPVRHHRLTPARLPRGTDEWLTPPHILDALGTFDLDPCSPITRPWPTAHHHYTLEDDGLSQPWSGRIWLNPPYSQAHPWIRTLARHGTGTALIFARTDTNLWFTDIWPHATGILFLRGRVTFHLPNGRSIRHTAPAPSVLIAYGDDDTNRLAKADLPGHFIDLRECSHR